MQLDYGSPTPPTVQVPSRGHQRSSSSGGGSHNKMSYANLVASTSNSNSNSRTRHSSLPGSLPLQTSGPAPAHATRPLAASTSGTSNSVSTSLSDKNRSPKDVHSHQRGSPPPRSQSVKDNAGHRILDELLEDMLEIIEADNEHEQDDDAGRRNLEGSSLTDGSSSDDSDSGDEGHEMEQSTSARQDAAGAFATGGEAEIPLIDKPVQKEREEGELDSEMDIDEVVEENANTTLREADAEKDENERKARKQRWRVENCISERDVYRYLRRRGFSKDLLGNFKRECVSKGEAPDSFSKEDRTAVPPAAPKEPIVQAMDATSARSDGNTSMALGDASSAQKPSSSSERTAERQEVETQGANEPAKETDKVERDVDAPKVNAPETSMSTFSQASEAVSAHVEGPAEPPARTPVDFAAPSKPVPVQSSAMPEKKGTDEISYKQLSKLHSIKSLIRKAEQWESSKLSVSKLLGACLKLAAAAQGPPAAPSTSALESLPERREMVDRGVSPPIFARQISIPLRRPSGDATDRPAAPSARDGIGAGPSATADRNRLPTPTSPTRVASSKDLPRPPAPSTSLSAHATGVNGMPNGTHASPPPSSLRTADARERRPAPPAQQSAAQREHAQKALALAAKFEQALNSKHLIFTRADLARLAPASATTSTSTTSRRNAQPTLAQSISGNGTRAPATPTTTNGRSESVREISPPASRLAASTAAPAAAAAAVSASASASPAVNGGTNAGRAFLGSSTRLRANAQYPSPSARKASPAPSSAVSTAAPAQDILTASTASEHGPGSTADLQGIQQTTAPGHMATDAPSTSAPVEQIPKIGHHVTTSADIAASNSAPTTVSAANNAVENDVSMDVGDDYPPAAIDATGANNAAEESRASKSPPPHVSPPISTTSTTQLVAPRQSAESIKAMFLGKKPTALPKRQAQASDFSGSNDVIAVAAKQGTASVDPRRAAAAAAARAKLLREKESAASASASASPPLPPPFNTVGASTTNASTKAPQARAASPLATATAAAELSAEVNDSRMAPQVNAAGKNLPKHPLPAKPAPSEPQNTSVVSADAPVSLSKLPRASVNNPASATQANKSPEEGEIEPASSVDISPAVALAISEIKESRESELKNRLKRQREQATEQSRKKRSIPTADDGSASDASTSSKKASLPTAPVANSSTSTRRLVHAGGQRMSEVMRNHNVDSDSDEDEAVEVTATKATTTATKSTLPPVEVAAKSGIPSRSNSADKDGSAQSVEKETMPKKHKSGTVVARKSTGGFKKKAPVSAPAAPAPASESVKVKLKLGGPKDGKPAETPISSAAKSTKKIPPAATIIDITDSSDDDDLVANTTVASKKLSPNTLTSSTSKPRPKARPYVGSSKQLADQSMSMEAESDSPSSSKASAIPPAEKSKLSAELASNKDSERAIASKEAASAFPTHKEPPLKEPRPPLEAPLQAARVTSTSTPTPKPRAAEPQQAPSMLDGKPLSSPPMRARDSASPPFESLNNGNDASDNESAGYSPSRMPRDTASPPLAQPIAVAPPAANGTNADEDIDELASTSPVISKAMQIASSQSPEANMLRGFSETGSDFDGGMDVDMLAEETQGNTLASQLLADIVSELPDIPRAQSTTSVSKRSRTANRSAERPFMDPMDLSQAFGSDEEDGEGSSISESALINNTSLSAKGASDDIAVTTVTSSATSKGRTRATASDFMLPTASTSASEQLTAVSPSIGTAAVPRETSSARSAAGANSKMGDVPASPAAPSEADSVEVIMSGQSPPKPFVATGAAPAQSASRDEESARAENTASLDALDRPLEDTFTRCKFATGCLNMNCSFAHPSPFLSAIKSRKSDLPKLGSQCTHGLQCQNEAARRKELCPNQATCPLGAKCAYRHADNLPAQHANRSWHSANQSARFESPSSSSAGGRTGSSIYAQPVMQARAAGGKSSSRSASPATIAAKQPLQQAPAASTSAAVAATSEPSQQEQALLDMPPSMRAYHQQQAALSKSTSWVAGLSNSGPMGWLAKATGFQNADPSKKP